MPYDLSDKHLLLVDDSAIMRMVLVMHLKRIFRVRITEAVDGLDAIAKLSKGEFDLVLTDINMPNLDGIGLVRYIREELKRDVPIVIITTRGEAPDRDRGMAMGADAYVTKPVNMKELFWTVLTFLGEKRHGRPADIS